MGDSHAEPGKIRMWLGHNAIAIYVGALLISAVDEIVQDVLLLKLTAVICLGFGAFATFLLIAYHDRQLCHHCMKEVPFLDPQAKVDKHIKKLRFAHRYALQYAILLGAIGLSLVELIAHFFGFKNVAISLVSTVGILIALVTVGYANRLHSRLQPWCPYCKNHGHGDDHHEVPEPPDPTTHVDVKQKATR